MSEEVKNLAEETAEEAVSETGKSKSRLKREQRAAEAKATKSKKNLDSIIGWIVGIVIAAIVLTVIGLGIYQSVGKTTTVANGDYAAGLNEDGTIKGAKLDKVKDIGLDSLSVDYSEVEYTDEEVEAAIQTALESHAFYSDDKTLTVKDGDTINLDYVGSVDGVEFDGGNTQGAGTTLTIGSGSYIDNFEEQLIGAHPGDSVTVNVTFPETYENNPDLAGKAAKFECVVNSIQTNPELTDEFIAENYESVAVTVEGYRNYLKENGYDINLKSYIANYIQENASVSANNKSYVKALMGLRKYFDEQTYSYYNSMYQMYYGYSLYSSFNDFTGMTDDEYEKYLKESSETQSAVSMTFEEFYKRKGLSYTEEDFNAFIEEQAGDTVKETYGETYLRQAMLQNEVLTYLAEHITVNK